MCSQGYCCVLEGGGVEMKEMMLKTIFYTESCTTATMSQTVRTMDDIVRDRKSIAGPKVGFLEKNDVRILIVYKGAKFQDFAPNAVSIPGEN